ncbi:SGNH/GDSL hydrolase family protein [uncultured Litoreibacter sp.]|uniref:SGNH/GDSL hydrolase family protein n=1 Tax=uncultured Litoreibacter sp. TaxID=1392394 RepID=UPI0026139179|nr:SGNH/GDSL hydrolase family protein [uncultured Litoreibacter sp.]
MRMILSKCLVFIVMLGFVAPPAAANEPRQVLVLGDSLLDWHRMRGKSIPQVLARQTGWKVRNRAASGAKMYLTGAEDNPRSVIPAQFEEGDWDWVVINGGANDLLTKCGCNRCEKVISGIISKDGKTGILPDLVRRARGTGAQVMMVGYIGNPRLNLFSGCKDDVLELVRRQKIMAGRLPGVGYFSTREVVDIEKRSSFALDGFHPSQKTTRKIGATLAASLKKLESAGN